MKTWLKGGLIGAILYPVLNLILSFLFFFSCYGVPRENVFCMIFKTITSLFTLPKSISWKIITSFGLQMGNHPLYQLSELFQFSITLILGLIIGFIIGTIIGLIVNKVRR